MGVGMATTNLFGHPAFKDGAFTSNDRGVRRAAIGKAMRFIDIAAELGAEVYVFWGGREGTEAGVAKDPRDALERYREAIDVLVGLRGRQRLRRCGSRWSPSPTSRAGTSSCRPSGHALHFIETLKRPEMVGVNPEVAHETMAGLSFHHAIGHALWAGKLFHIDLNAQRIGRYDQDFRFGAEDLKESFLLVRLLERAGYDGPLHFDAHAYRNENADGVWDFAAGCMATYRALAEKAAHFDSLPEVQEALEAASTPELGARSVDGDERRRAEGRVRGARRAGRARLLQRAARPARGRRAARRALSPPRRLRGMTRPGSWSPVPSIGREVAELAVLRVGLRARFADLGRLRDVGSNGQRVELPVVVLEEVRSHIAARAEEAPPVRSEDRVLARQVGLVDPMPFLAVPDPHIDVVDHPVIGRLVGPVSSEWVLGV